MSEANVCNGDNFSLAANPEIVEFGPYRVIGTQYIGKNEHGEIPAMWQNDFIPRMGEIEKAEGPCMSFGLCRCLPGVMDGNFDYIAGLPAQPDAPIPHGMVEVAIPQCKYGSFPVRNLSEIGRVWQYTQEWFAAHGEWKRYCDETVCDCAHYPCFEYYPPEFMSNGTLFVYVPVQNKS